MSTNINNLRVTKHDTLEDAKVKNEKLINMVKKLQKKVRGLKTDNKTLQDVCNLNDAYLHEIVKDIPFSDILECVNNKKPLKKFSKKCPGCQSIDIKQIELGDFDIIICNNCNFKNKLIKDE